MPHSLVTALSFEVPVGKGRRFGGSMPRAVEAVVGAWEVSSISAEPIGRHQPQRQARGKAYERLRHSQRPREKCQEPERQRAEAGAITERVRTQLRGEFYNITNTPQFSPPGLTVGAADFGQVNGTRFADRRNIQVGLKILF